MKSEDLAPKKSSSVKTAYTAPKLLVYGDLRVITQNMRRAGDDGSTKVDNFST